jgi:protein-disulfide isomerase
MRPFAALLVCLSLAAALSACSKTTTTGAVTGDMSLGSPQAKVTIYEYASVGCPICAKWNNDNFAAFKTKYIDSGKVHYILREMRTGDGPVAAAGFLLARCAGKDKYFQVIDAVFREEAELLESGRGGEERDRLVKVAQTAGLTEDQFNACVSNDAALNDFNARTDKTARDNNIESTPTFVVNGKILTGYQDMPTLDKAIADAEAAAK